MAKAKQNATILNNSPPLSWEATAAMKLLSHLETGVLS